jgi:gamma-glutamyl:cysteine ligase YbdK (ATP-grasp superfamily)
MYKTLEVLGPEHEYSIVNKQLEPLPIVDKVLKTLSGRITNTVRQDKFTFGKELQLHVMELKPNQPFRSPVEFEGTMQEAVLSANNLLNKDYSAALLGTGMHPLLRLGETGIWPHRDRLIYDALAKIFNLRQHGWLNIQSFQLNLPYSNEKDAILLHAFLANLCPYLPAICASSPIVEGRIDKNLDNRLIFYAKNQQEIPSITGEIIPEYVGSFKQYREQIIARYSKDLASKGADESLLNKEWINSRGTIIRFDRRAFEIRVMDEQECVKSDVALSCFIRSLSRGWMRNSAVLMSHGTLVADLESTIRNGLDGKTRNPCGCTAQQICQHLLRTAEENATTEEKRYLPLIAKRIERGSLANIIRDRVKLRAQKTELKEAIVDVYTQLIKSLIDNEPYF